MPVQHRLFTSALRVHDDSCLHREVWLLFRCLCSHCWRLCLSCHSIRVYTAELFHMRLWICRTLLQEGQECSTSLQASTQNGMKQQGQHRKSPSTPQITQVSRPFLYWILVTTVFWQWGHNICPGASVGCCCTTTTWFTGWMTWGCCGEYWKTGCGTGWMPGWAW